MCTCIVASRTASQARPGLRPWAWHGLCAPWAQDLKFLLEGGAVFVPRQHRSRRFSQVAVSSKGGFPKGSISVITHRSLG